MRCCPLSVLHYACARASSLHLLVKNIVFTYSREIERDCMLFIVLTCHWFHWTSGLINPCSLNDKRIVSELCSKSTEATLIFTKNSVNPVLWNMLTACNVKMRPRGPAKMSKLRLLIPRRKSTTKLCRRGTHAGTNETIIDQNVRHLR